MRNVELLFRHKSKRLARFYRLLFARLERLGECLVWTGELSGRGGYGVVATELNRKRYRYFVHRVTWEQATGKRVPRNRVLDHLCRNTRCAEPTHLEPTTRAENTRRQAAAIHGSDPGRRCKNGHVGEYRTDPKSRKRYCKGCARDNARRYYHERKAA